ncbi:MAG TPA: class I SAM-dependent methyltransferase [Candidatus Cybelea sp.]|jgi:predicted O-methyltransferase YrrM
MKLSAHELEAMQAQPHPLLLELEQHGRKDGIPVVSRQTGRLLSTLVTAMQASRILEVGTGYGYATLWMALAQPRMGKIWTIDSDVARTDVARSYFRRAEEDDFIEVFNTPVLELLQNFPHRNLDIAFISSDEGYQRYLELVIPMLKLSGLAIFHHAAEAKREFCEAFLARPDLDSMILPLENDAIAIGARRQ